MYCCSCSDILRGSSSSVWGTYLEPGQRSQEALEQVLLASAAQELGKVSAQLSAVGLPNHVPLSRRAKYASTLAA